ncbi:MAG: hypothetical protein QW589_08265 [Candidatus Bathyarchaeia archaeon]
MIDFKKEILVELLNPFLEFKPEIQLIEFRKDLLKDWCRISLKRIKRLKQEKGKLSIKELIESSKKNCFFVREILKSKAFSLMHRIF